MTPLVSALTVTVDMPDRVAGGDDLVCPPEGLRVTFAPAFRKAPALAFNDQGMQSGDRREATAKDRTGFDVRYLDAANQPVPRSFDWVARGYGYEAA